MPTPGGRRDRLIVLQRATVTTDAHGGESLAWADLGETMAQVMWGSGAERRGAAQERASVPATFRVLRSSVTEALTAADRISFDGAFWDITSAVPFGRHDIDITATRSA